MRISTVETPSPAFAGWYAVYAAALRADYPDGPCWRERDLAVLYAPTEHYGSRLWVAESRGRAVGAAAVGLPRRDNLGLGELELFVHPEHRRQGVGTALLAVVEQALRDQRRDSLLAYIEGPASSRNTPGTAFAQARGFTRRIVEIARVQRPPFDLDRIAAAQAHARPLAPGYTITTWRDGVPDEYVDEYARLQARLSTDAPLGELDYEGEVWDAERVRDEQERYARMGRSTWTTVAIVADRTLAGVTVVTVPTDDDRLGMQETTLVDPRHRNHRLGLLIKAANFQAVLRDRSDVEEIWTWNAESNDPMIRINETLGYRVAGWSAGWQKQL